MIGGVCLKKWRKKYPVGVIDGLCWEGRYILVKSVLENIYVYWLSLEKIPKSILNMIRRQMFSFLWLGNKEIERFHLVNWNRIAKPKKIGGWDLKIFYVLEKLWLQRACGGAFLAMACGTK
jgi:hypothetical protein